MDSGAIGAEGESLSWWTSRGAKHTPAVGVGRHESVRRAR